MKRVIRGALEWAGYRIVPALPAHDLRLMNLVNALKQMAGTNSLFRQFLDYGMQRFDLSNAQLMQDLFVDFVLQKEDGTFVEFGAYDGVTFSNSLYLESIKNWRGLLAEPTPRLQQLIAQQRPLATLEKRCVYSRSGEILEFTEAKSGDLSTIRGLEQSDHMGRSRRSVNVHKVETVSLDDLITTHFSSRHVDYISIDTEGSEWVILQSYNFTARPAVFTVEHNFTDTRERVAELMKNQGYLNVFAEFTGFDGWFVRADLWHSRFGM
jgi:FkbM family methyltransferase